MSFNNDYELISLLILILSCGLLLVGFSMRNRSSGPWVMLLGICSALGIIAYNILRHTGALSNPIF